jgi:hypothetical protein
METVNSDSLAITPAVHQSHNKLESQGIALRSSRLTMESFYQDFQRSISKSEIGAGGSKLKLRSR